MRQNGMFIAFLCLMMLYSINAYARNWRQILPPPRVLTDMMQKEKKAGVLNDSLYANYLVDSLGYEEMLINERQFLSDTNNYKVFQAE